MPRTPDTPEATDPLSSPTSPGQTRHLVRLDGSSVATVCWEALPYHLRSVWGSRAAAARPERLHTYLELDASPLALALAARSDRLEEPLRELARQRLGALGVTPSALERLERHFRRLLRGSRSRLLTHLAIAERADPTLDRLDLLAEVVALRDAAADVVGERSLARAFRAMFVTTEPFVVWLIITVSLAAFLVFAKSASPSARGLYEHLALEPGLARPWTLLTYAFLHQLDDWRHVVLNMLALALIGQVLEQLLGHWRFFGVFLLGAVGAGLASALTKTLLGVPFATVGASGAVAALAGLALFLGLSFQARYGRIPLRYASGTLIGGVVLVSNLLLSATSLSHGVDHGAHLGGLLVGVLLGVAIRPALFARADARFGR